MENIRIILLKKKKRIILLATLRTRCRNLEKKKNCHTALSYSSEFFVALLFLVLFVRISQFLTLASFQVFSAPFTCFIYTK